MIAQQTRYTAKLTHQDQLVSEISGNDLSKLQTQLLLQLEECGSGTQGVIIDNASGTVVHRARYTTPAS